MQQPSQKLSNSEYEELISKSLKSNSIKEKSIVNGKVVIDDGEHTGETPGKVLRRGPQGVA